MNYKFTSDGKKVVVVGALNAKETIVQEVFVTNGTEFPAGEHFVVKTLLETPAETYKAKEERRTLESIKKLEHERDRLAFEVDGFRFKSRAAAAKIKWIDGVTNDEVKTVFDNLMSIVSGDYTHVFFPMSMEIKEWGHNLFARTEDYSRNRFESLQLMSLFGEWTGRLALSWKINTYRDGSGSYTNIIPCKSLAEAVNQAKEIIYAKEHLSDSDYEFCIEHSIPVDQTKNAVRVAKRDEYIKKQIEGARAKLQELENKLERRGL